MSEPKHTPGPWRVELTFDCEGDQPPLITAREGKMPVAEVLSPLADEFGLHRGHYDCTLIAAAPNLLAILERAVENRIDDDWLATARAAIARAKGE